MTDDEIVLHREPVEHIPVVIPQETSREGWRYECGCGHRSPSVHSTLAAAMRTARFHARSFYPDGPRYVDEAGNEWRKVTP